MPPTLPTNPLEILLKHWKKEGYRMTRVRESLLDLFLTVKAPLSIEEAQARLKRRKIPANTSTVYREMDFLQNEGALKEVLLEDGKRRFEWALGEHHHHLYCQNCESIEDIEMDNELQELERSIQKKKNFKISSHTLEFSGLCSKCL